MPKKPSVNIKTQLVLMSIPYLSIWAYYRIGKIRMCLLTSTVSTVIFLVSLLIGEVITNWLGEQLPAYESMIKDISVIIIFIDLFIIQYILSARELRKWSKDWNEKI